MCLLAITGVKKGNFVLNWFNKDVVFQHILPFLRLHFSRVPTLDLFSSLSLPQHMTRDLAILVALNHYGCTPTFKRGTMFPHQLILCHLTQ